MNELLIKNGHVIDPANKIDRQADVLIVDGKVAEIVNRDARRKTRDRSSMPQAD